MGPTSRACALLVLLCLAEQLVVMGQETAGPPPLEAPPAGKFSEQSFIQSEGFLSLATRAETPGTEAPVVQQATIYSEEAFGPDSVPLEIFRSEGHQLGLPKLPNPPGGRNGSGEAICKTGYFNAVPQYEMNQYPTNVIGRLYLKFGKGWGWCSGMQLSDDVVLTAAHCAYSCESRQWVEGGGYYDGRYGDSYRAYSPIKSMATWTSCDMTGTGFYDFALMRLGKKIEKSAYPITYAPSSKAFDASTQGYIYSYPAVTRSGNVPHLSFQDPVLPKYMYGYPGRVELPLSIEQGSSGSPLFLGNLPASFPWSNAVVGVSSYGYTNGQCPNGFAMFTESYNPTVLLRSLRQ